MSVHRTIMGDSVDDTFRWVSEYDWILKSNIDGPTNIHIEWIDTVSEIYLNGDSIGNTDNSFVSYNFFIPNSGLLSIVLKSPIKYVEARVGDEIPSECPPWGIPGVQYIRTAQSQFGWDWGPAVPTMGIGLVELNYHDHHVRVDTLRLSENEWQVNVCMEEEMESELFMYDEFGVEIFLGHFFNKYFSFIVYNVSVWWPRGHGAQPLYRISICTPSRGCIVEKIGFRDFFFENNLIVNGKTIEILGSNLIPPSQFRPYSDSLIEEIFYSFLNQSDGMNLIRVWGGGFFGDSKLYDLCDEYGVIVWEELKFAGATYEWEKIWETVQVEIQQNIGQRYNHVSLMIVSGDNEIELMLKQNWFNIDLNVLEKKKFEYDEFSKKLVSFLKSKFPTLIVFPSSPMNDTHYYDFESDCRDLSLFPENASLVSEYGYQSFANSDTFPDINWLNADYRESEFVRNRQHRIGGTEWILMQASLIFEQTFYTVKWLIWVSQILQSICLKSATEFFRRQPTNAGVMYWQLNDVWPTVSWSLIDYARTPKLAYFYVKPSYHQKLYSLYREGDILKYCSNC